MESLTSSMDPVTSGDRGDVRAPCGVALLCFARQGCVRMTKVPLASALSALKIMVVVHQTLCLCPSIGRSSERRARPRRQPTILSDGQVRSCLENPVLALRAPRVVSVMSAETSSHDYLSARWSLLVFIVGAKRFRRANGAGSKMEHDAAVYSCARE